MEKKLALSKYEKELSFEIENQRITIDQLIKCGVSKDVLSCEVYLRKIYGDEIIENTFRDDLDESKTKSIKKIEDSERSIDAELRAVVEDIENSEFDKNLDAIVK